MLKKKKKGYFLRRCHTATMASNSPLNACRTSGKLTAGLTRTYLNDIELNINKNKHTAIVVLPYIKHSTFIVSKPQVNQSSEQINFFFAGFFT